MGYNKGDDYQYLLHAPSALSYSQSNLHIFIQIHSSHSPISIRVTNNNNTATSTLMDVLFLSLPADPFCPPGILGAFTRMSYRQNIFYPFSTELYTTKKELMTEKEPIRS